MASRCINPDCEHALSSTISFCPYCGFAQGERSRRGATSRKRPATARTTEVVLAPPAPQPPTPATDAGDKRSPPVPPAVEPTRATPRPVLDHGTPSTAALPGDNLHQARPPGRPVSATGSTAVDRKRRYALLVGAIAIGAVLVVSFWPERPDDVCQSGLKRMEANFSRGDHVAARSDATRIASVCADAGQERAVALIARIDAADAQGRQCGPALERAEADIASKHIESARNRIAELDSRCLASAGGEAVQQKIDRIDKLLAKKLPIAKARLASGDLSAAEATLAEIHAVDLDDAAVKVVDRAAEKVMIDVLLPTTPPDGGSARATEKKAGAPGLQSYDARPLLDKAESALREGSLDAARAYSQAALGTDPGNPAAKQVLKRIEVLEAGGRNSKPGNGSP